MLPLLSFDSTGMCFMCVAVAFSIAGSLFIARCMDKMKLSRWFCGRDAMLDVGKRFLVTT